MTKTSMTAGVILHRLIQLREYSGEDQGKRRIVDQDDHTAFQQIRDRFVRAFRILDLRKGGKVVVFDQLLQIAAVQHAVDVDRLQPGLHFFDERRVGDALDMADRHL